MRYYGVGRVYWSGHGAPPLSFSLFTPCFALASSLSLSLPLFPLDRCCSGIFLRVVAFSACSCLSLSLSLLFFSRWRFSERCRIRLMRGYEEFFPSLFFLFFFFSRFSQEMLFVLGRVELEWNTNWRAIVHLLMREYDGPLSWHTTSSRKKDNDYCRRDSFRYPSMDIFVLFSFICWSSLDNSSFFYKYTLL